MEKKKKITIVISVVVFLFILAVGTVAFFRWNSPTNTDVGFNIDGLDAYIIYNKGTDVLTGLLEPTDSYTNTSISTEITLYKNTTKTLYGHIYLDIEQIGANLANEPALKWAITSNNQVLNEGNFVGSKVGDSKALKINIPLSQTEQKFQIYIWLDENMDINDAIEGETLSTIVRAEASEVEYPTPGIDNSGANYPKLVDNMIPVMYDGTNWVKADTTSSTSTYGWYDYNAKKWANAVLVSETNRSTYLSAEAGTVIPESEVLAYYVWIPRYKYKVFNISKTIGTDSYDAKTTGIDIVFEQGTASTGEINCNNYSFATATSSATNETCSGTNGQYYTHPAFTFGDTELTGIWVGKFESASSNPSAGYGGGNSTTLTVRVKPNMNTWRYNPVSNFYTVIKNMQNNGNEYGLSSDTSKVDSHMLKNIEWGAVAYLTHSDYGRCSNGSCSEIGINNYYSGSGSSRQYKTGCGANAGSSSSGTCNEYTTSLGMNASSTGNIYGIYDLSGGAYEYVMGNMSSGSGSYTYNAKSAGSNFSYSASTAKYIDTYAYGTRETDQTAYNRARLGDATGEVVSSSSTAWNNDYAYFVTSYYPWFQRGGGYTHGSGAGVFIFHNKIGDANTGNSARAALLAL